MALSWPRSSQLVDEKRENRTLTTVFDIWILFEMSFLDFNDGGGKSVEWFLYDNGLRHERVKYWSSKEASDQMWNQDKY